MGKTVPNMIAIRNDVLQSTTAPIFLIIKFHNKVTMPVITRVIANVITTFNKILFAFICLFNCKLVVKN